MGIFIDGFGISGYRSFGKNVQRIGPLNKINIFAGQNNSGKSNILNYLVNQYGRIFQATQTQRGQFKIAQIDLPLKNWDGKTRVAVGLTHGSDTWMGIFAKLNLDGNLISWLETALKSPDLSNGTNITWFPFEDTGQTFSLNNELIDHLAKNTLDDRRWRMLWEHITRRGGGALRNHWIPETLEWLVAQIVLPSFSIIPSVRRYSQERTDKSDDFSGVGIIERLAKLQNPSYQEQNLKNQFSKINNFVQEVTGNQTATLEIPYDRSEILVHMDEKTLPLTSLGTGIHEVIIMASTATILSDQIVCIEEPELHMHPELQKKFVDYLERETSNQYFITTHSASILDRPNISIFHVSLDNGVSVVSPVSSAAQRFSVCVDLGYRASDLVQSNCIIWVEGPSDRIYLKWWINAIAPDLIEGVHYSIMFYGGRLLSHLTADDPEVEEFISLRRLNRNISIIIDSDKKSRQNEINDTKKRVAGETVNAGLAWITDGREIENYIERGILEAAAKEIHPSIAQMKYRTKYDDPLNAATEKGAKVMVDKIKLAHKIVQKPVNLAVLDLRERIEMMVAFIRSSNCLEKNKPK